MRAAIAFISRYRAEFFTATAWLAGWYFLTSAVAVAVAGHWSAALWRLSLGALAICLGGPRLLWHVLTHGLYSLTRDEDTK